MFGDVAVVQEADVVGAPDGARPVRHHHHRAACHQPFDSLVHRGFVHRVKRRRHLVQPGAVAAARTCTSTPPVRTAPAFTS
ncbi:hypothetical protein [Amycolatopsis thermoflava]|uniref:hypothetical protein n=1 Tax=Amycolatopsis thermoflava TaxID=84480 RepID=UPI003D7407A3